MKNDLNSGFVDYPELTGKTLENVEKDGNSLFFTFKDGSSFTAVPKEVPNTETFLNELTPVVDTQENGVMRAVLRQRGSYADTSDKESDTKLTIAHLCLEFENCILVWSYTAKSSVAESIQLDTKFMK